jgi:flagellar basal-body rod modification protein FlgD
MVSGVSSGLPVSGDSSANKAKKSIDTEYGNFLKMLTTQLQNQDPTAPLDANQFTQQIVSFTEVEQSIATNTNLEKLISMNETESMNSAVSYINKEVEIDGSTSALSKGSALFSYTLGANSDQTVVSITNAEGNTVFTGEGETKTGNHVFKWNGRDTEGNLLDDGNYQISVTAVKKDGTEVASSTSVKGIVTGVTKADGEPALIVNGATVALEKIKGVSLAAPKNS